MAQPKAPEIMRPDLYNRYLKMMTESLEKLNKFVEHPFVRFQHDGDEKLFRLHSDNLRLGTVVLIPLGGGEADFGFVVSITDMNISVKFLSKDHDMTFEKVNERMYKNHTYLLLSEMTVDEFVKLSAKKIHDEKMLDKPARITNRDVRKMKDDIRTLKKELYKLTHPEQNRDVKYKIDDRRAFDAMGNLINAPVDDKHRGYIWPPFG